MQEDSKTSNTKQYLCDIVPTETVIFILSFLHLVDLVKTANKVNKQFHHYVTECSSHLWRQYCKSYNIINPDSNTISWKSVAIRDIKHQMSISRLLNWEFPTLHPNRVDIQSKYIHSIIKSTLINHKQIIQVQDQDQDQDKEENKHNNTLLEYESIELYANSNIKSMVRCDNKEILMIDSFVIQSFDRLRALGNILMDDSSERATNDIWEGYKRRGDIYWKQINSTKDTIIEWLEGALCPQDEFISNLYCINNRSGMGEFGQTAQEQKEDDDYIESAESFIDLFISTFCDNNKYRFYIAGHIASDSLDLDRDEMIIAINDIKVFGFYVYYSNYYDYLS